MTGSNVRWRFSNNISELVNGMVLWLWQHSDKRVSNTMSDGAHLTLLQAGPVPKRPLVTCPTRGPCKPPLREAAVFVENRGLFGRKTRVLREKNVILAGVFSSFRGFYGSKWLARKNYRSLASCQKNPPETRPSVFVFFPMVVIFVRETGNG